MEILQSSELQNQRNGLVGHEAIWRDFAIHRENFHTCFLGASESLAEFRMDFVVGAKALAAFHLYQEQDAAFVGRAVFGGHLLRFYAGEFCQVLDSSFRGGVGEGGEAVVLQGDSFHFQEHLAVIEFNVEIEPRIPEGKFRAY